MDTNSNAKLLDLTSERKALTQKQIENVYRYSKEIIGNLSDKALLELTEAYDDDLENLLSEIVNQTNNVINYDKTSLNSEKLEYLNYFEKEMDEQLKIMSYNYFKATSLTNFRMQWRNIEWGNLIQLFSDSAYICQRGSGKSFEFCFALPLWRLYSYNKKHPLIKNTKDNLYREETCIITNERRLVNIHISKIVDEIKINDVLAAKINPNGKASLAGESVKTESGAVLHSRSYNSFIRGIHVGCCITDDFLDKSCLYSLEQRNKFHEVFYGEIKSIIDEGGYNIVCGTPFHQMDLYGDLKNDDMFKVFQYPGVMPNGELLAPDRYTYPYLEGLKKSLGSLVFSREHLITPVSDSASIFPWTFLNMSKLSMENVKYVSSRSDYPIKLRRVVIGVDLSKSANIGADYTVFETWGADSNDVYYLLNIYRAKGISYNEQISTLISLDNRFKPNEIVVEDNGFQSIIADMLRERGLKNVRNFTTTSSVKKDWMNGVPSISALFERNQIKIPYNNDEKTREQSDSFLQEFSSITFNDDNGKLESADGKDDQVMSAFFALTSLREHKLNFTYNEI